MIDHSGRVTKPVVMAAARVSAAVGCHGNGCDVTSHLPARADAGDRREGLAGDVVRMSDVDADGRQVAGMSGGSAEDDCDAEVCWLLRHAAFDDQTTTPLLQTVDFVINVYKHILSFPGRLCDTRRLYVYWFVC